MNDLDHEINEFSSLNNFHLNPALVAKLDLKFYLGFSDRQLFFTIFEIR
jgi:hypothetical protein